MTWTYRVVQRRDHRGTLWFGIHEAYYNEKGEVTMISEEPIAPGGETVEELKSDITHYFQALLLSVLDYDQIGKFEATAGATDVDDQVGEP